MNQLKFPGVNRRAFLSATALGVLAGPLAAFLGSGAQAQQADGLREPQAEWRQSYDTSERLAVSRETTPVLSAATLSATEAAIQQYQGIVARGGWNAVPAGAELRIGVKSKAVQALRQRLVVSGDLDSVAGTGPVFDSFVEAAVKRFQARHGQGETGIVNEQTFTELNIPAEARLRQLETNIVRLRAFSGNLGERFVMVNIPAAAVETVENGVVYSHHAAGVGKIDRQSPIMQAKATQINFNPFWTVPPSLIKKDLIPKMQADPSYLTEEKIRVFNKEGQEVSPQSINWNSLDATNYKYRQDTGADINSLGFVRVNIPNPYGVYMHDTPSKGIFGDDFRFVSSGCVRVQDVRDYVAWLLKDTPGWSRDQIDEVIRSGQRQDVTLSSPVNVYWVYVTAWATPDGVVQFREDIYQRDGAGPGPMATAIPAQPLAAVQE
ncbi:murein L,D-transpeptidase [Methylocapsa sp. S129]|uniref:L,D-transpeptidase family protein n=1 Tax=Methylocapsa sp. S129 TaxID=1641869 RepID=UPI00131AE950|nr:L,D-transpeptidase family protein [Methylocapsa sp. S129]